MSATATRGQLRASGTWRVDPAHSSIEFRVRHRVVESVRGRFLDFEGVVEAGETPVMAAFIRVSSLETHDAGRDAHLRSPDFFDVERHPEILFESTGVELSDSGVLVVLGLLTIREIALPIQLIGTFHGRELGVDGRERLCFEVRGALNRQDYGLTWNRRLESGGLWIGNTVELALEVAAVRDVPLERAA